MNRETAKGAPRALFQEAVALFTGGRHADAVVPLARAAEAGDAEAQNLLGVMHLNAMGLPQDPRQAATLFAAAAESGLKEGHYNLSNLLFNGLGAARDPDRARRHLLAAARAGHRPALRSLGFLYHAVGEEGAWPARATACFRAAAESGDPLAKYLHGLRLLRGHGIAPDPAAAARWLRAAAAEGVQLAAYRLAGLPATGREQAATAGGVEFMDCAIPVLAPAAASRTLAFMSEHTAVLDEYLCDHLMNLAAPKLAPSGVVDPHTGAAVQSGLRTSYSMHFAPSMYDLPVHLALRQIANVAGLPVEHAEPLGVLRYGPGQEYRPHYDYYSDDQHQAQRVSTVFVFLNDVAEGGGTDFPRLGVKVEPARGKAVKFLNCDAEGRPNPDTLHAGLPVIRGEKWLATLWFWDRPFMWFA
jgi:TPR repeat protein